MTSTNAVTVSKEIPEANAAVHKPSSVHRVAGFPVNTVAKNETTMGSIMSWFFVFFAMFASAGIAVYILVLRKRTGTGSRWAERTRFSANRLHSDI